MSADAASASRHGHTAETKTSVAISPKSVAQEWLPRFGAARACADGAGLQSNQEIGIDKRSYGFMGAVPPPPSSVCRFCAFSCERAAVSKVQAIQDRKQHG